MEFLLPEVFYDFSVDCEGKFTFLTEASPEVNRIFSKQNAEKLDDFSVAREDKCKKIHTKIYEKLDYFLKSNKIPHIIFHGASGTGKKTIVYNFINTIYQNDLQKRKTNVMFVNCAHGKGIKFIRDELKFFAKTNVHITNFPSQATANTFLPPERSEEKKDSGVLFKTIVLLNADFLTVDAQSALRRCIELFSYNTRFFIIVENKNKLLCPILSRFCEIYVPECKESSGTEFPKKSLNLHQYNLSLSNDFIKYKEDRKEELILILKEFNQFLLKREHESIEKYIFKLSSELYEKGFSCLDIIQQIHILPSRATEKSNNDLKPSSTERSEEQLHILMRFYKIKGEYRNEKLLMVYILNMIVYPDMFLKNTLCK
jgi:hypothetical protein